MRAPQTGRVGGAHRNIDPRRIPQSACDPVRLRYLLLVLYSIEAYLFVFISSFLDSVSERYAKIRQNLDKCFPLQVGLVPFTYDRDLVEYKATVYKFNVFPTFFGPFDPNVTFKSSTVQFLSKYNFDFNKVRPVKLKYANLQNINNLRVLLSP